MSLDTLITNRQVIRLVILAVAFFGIITAPNSAHAQEASVDTASIALTPVIQKSVVKAGSTTSNKIKVINNGTTTYTFTVYSRPFSVKNEQYDPQFEIATGNSDIYQWITFAQSSYTLNPGERVEVPYTIYTPVNAAPGGHYGVIFAETVAETDSNDSVQRKKRIGSIVASTVEGDVTRQGKLLDSSSAFWQTTPPLTATNRIQNTGNTDFSATVLTSVKDLFGSEKHRETKDYVIYPGTVRKVVFSWSQSPWFGIFKLEQKVTILEKTESSTKYVLVVPRWLLVVLIITTVASAGYMILRHRRS